MDIDLDLRKLVEYYQEIDPLAVPLEEAVKRMVRFCEKLHAAVEHTPFEKRKDLGLKLTEVSKTISRLTQPYIENTGFNEEELLHIVENKEDFNEEIWRMVQESKHQVIDCIKKVITAMLTLESKQATKEVPKTNKKKPPHQPPKSGWMKS
jgi:hypothetical protein